MTPRPSAFVLSFRTSFAYACCALAMLAAPLRGADPISDVKTNGGNVSVVSEGVDGITSTNTPGIRAETSGTSTAVPPLDPFLGVALPDSANVQGGKVDVFNSRTISTTSTAVSPSATRLAAIQAQARTAGFPASVAAGLRAFTGTHITFVVDEASLTHPDGSAAGFDTPIAATRVDDEGRDVLDADGNKILLGSFTIAADGAVTYTPAEGSSFDFLANEQAVNVAVKYSVTGKNANNNQTASDSGALIARISRDKDGVLTQTWGAVFDWLGSSDTPTASALPDVAGYVHGLTSAAESGGAGNSVTVRNEGTITASGWQTSGISGSSSGNTGAPGRDGSMFRSAGGGGAGSAGGDVTIEANGTITTDGGYAPGVLGQSTGGTGGKGGDGGWFRWGGVAGPGGNSGTVSVTGDGTIKTGGAHASGIVALSAGGNGGNGGTADLVTPGGSGGAGARSGPAPASDGTVDPAVRVDGSWTITTSGQEAYGIWAKSVGGNAGAGGSGGWIDGDSGSGGSAADGGLVIVESGGSITTTGKNAHGIYAESVGGFGGVGAGQFSLFSASGGNGGSAGSGGDVSVTQLQSGVIHTEDAGAHGIFAQSVGGGGGSGGNGKAFWGEGGSAGFGGNGGDVTVVNDGEIQAGIKIVDGEVVVDRDLPANGTWARGVYAQSIGGKGGDGGAGSGVVGLGGVGSAASNAGEVHVTNNGTIASLGQAIYAQSVGGGGGSGGSAGGWASIGGSSGGGGMGGKVTVVNNGGLTTYEDSSAGIFAQSVGGGGGDGGGSAGGTFSIGGKGGKGGAASTVDVTQSGSITTKGDDSFGVLAQAVGGGGGNGGSAYSGSSSSGLAVGGSGAGGGKGGEVRLHLESDEDSDEPTSSTISTTGDRAVGIFAQSVGGGGGNGGAAIQSTSGIFGSSSTALGGNAGEGGDGLTVSLDGRGNVTTTGDAAVGILLQSVGGGGGNGGMTIGSAEQGGLLGGAVSVSLGGTGGKGGIGGRVESDVTTAITTSGDVATGFIAQSVGGGGGNGGTAVAVSVSGNVLGGAAVSVGVGGDGGEAGTGGAVDVTLAGSVHTSGNQSDGVLVQSVGGSGGNGGMSISAAIAGGGVAAGSVGTSIGGTGGGGGNAGTVAAHVTARGTWNEDGSLTGGIVTSGDGADAVIVQAIGGGGGNGGMSAAGSASLAGVAAGAVSVGIGGDGAKGGHGGHVDAQFQGDISTTGKNATGVLVQSVGGGGGNGGGTIAAAVSGSGVVGVGVGVGLGGSGDVGGDGGSADDAASIDPDDPDDALARAAVEATIGGKIVTDGVNSAGVVVQSVGGGGGNGGYSITASGTLAGVAGVGVSVGVGGEGKGGGQGKAVKATLTADVTTKDESSTAILVQSVGGGGGNGGYSVSGSAAAAGGGAVGVTVGLGGKAGTGSAGGSVAATSTGDVSTEKDNSAALVVQSIGGGGGNGGFTVSGTAAGAGIGSGAITVGLGGDGAGGGAGGDVHASTGQVGETSAISTTGKNSIGFLAQSVGGGGGNGGYSVTGSFSGAGAVSGAIGVGLGGDGAGGGAGGDVDATSYSKITTSGEFSHAFVAQSIGGGGGTGGYNVTVAASGSGTGSGAVSVGLGGGGGTASAGGEVNADTHAFIQTSGRGAVGVLAQSVGGGGGSGGFNVSAAASGAGTGSGAVSVGLGGDGGGGGAGGKVTLDVVNNVVTLADHATAVIAQSVGGGGGNGSFSVSASASGAGSGSGAVGVNIGGSGDGGGNGGDVDSEVTGLIETHGARAIGVLVQSVGGGGGNGGTSVAAAISGAKAGSGALVVGVGGSGGGGGDGGQVDSTVTGRVSTGQALPEGVSADRTAPGDASAVIVQSIGGGGGNGGTNVSSAVSVAKDGSGALAVGVGGFGAGGGAGGAVTSTVTGIGAAGIADFSTLGNNSTAIVAQSIGGGGGNGGTNVSVAASLAGKNGAAVGVGVGGFGAGGGDASTVDLTVSGNVLTRGSDSHGILAQSVGGGGGNGGTNVSGTLNVVVEGKGLGGSASIGVGGFGGQGGVGEKVTATFENGSIITLRPEVAQADSSDAPELTGASAMVVQSIGGGGGNGGVNVSAGMSYAAAKDGDGHALMVGVGGFGGAGSKGGEVEATVNDGDTLTAWGDDHATIFAQSVGGGGGNGAVNVSGGIASDSPIVVGVGGMAGDGGVAGNVTATITAKQIISSGDRSAGIFAQSLGGGGGNGGLNVSGAISLDKENDSPSITFGIGGFGGDGAQSGEVKVTHEGAIATSGAWSHGILAQSLGGGGGNGGLNIAGSANRTDAEQSDSKGAFSVVVGLGGHGGDGAEANTATVESRGAITTSGDYARGVFAQSVGGGGGTGAVNVSGVVAKNQSAAVIGVGGFGGDGADAKLASVTRGSKEEAGGLIKTSGAGAFGIEASSIGGGGGDAGANLVLMYAPVDDSNSGGDGDDDSGGSEGGGDQPKERAHPKHTGVDDQVFKNYDNVLAELEARQKPKAEAPPKREGQPEKKKTTTYSAQVAIGGSAGSAGDGAVAEVKNYGDVETSGRDSHAILAQSVGGGGGNARLNVVQGTTGDNTSSYGLNLAVGGGTGEGGAGGRVEVNNHGGLMTTGDEAFGILAQSIGGGGGNTGTDIINADGKGNALDIKIGREGGSGGVGSEVKVASDGAILTSGEHAHAIMAQSVGNGGGRSSSHSFSARKADGGDDKKQTAAAGADGDSDGDKEDDDAAESLFQLEIGVAGGTGGAAGHVDVETGGTLETRGDRSHAIFAQSVGGGGGEAGGAGDEDTVTSSFMLMMGGAGGTAGIGGEVDVASSAGILTHGEASVGILAQSVGGGGGTGGEVTANAKAGKYGGHFLGIGGVGDNASDGGAVTVGQSGTVDTFGRESHGILAQSVAGGGGSAGSVTRSLESSSPVGIDVNLTIGGAGGAGGVGGRVEVANTGEIRTRGDEAIGIFAQSVGGGGGNGSRVISKSVSGTEGAGNHLNILVGGTGRGGGKGGEVIVRNGEPDTESETQGEAADETTALILTTGRGAHGIFAMSIGGGGGSGSTIVRSDSERESGEYAPANGFTLGLGGGGAEGGEGSKVTVVNSGWIETRGDEAHGVIAQSVGGGGGNGGLVLSGDLVLGGTPGSDTATTGSLMIGGNGGSGNKAGDVSVANSGTIVARGDRSYGIFAQSVGGGGGNGGFTGSLSGDLRSNPALNPSGYLADFGLGGRGGSGGDGGHVLVENTGSILVEGDNAYGVFAQSVSGGGGTAGVALTSPVWMATNLALDLALGFNGASGTPGEVEVRSSGTIVTTGSNSRAIFRQAVNGGGGSMDVFMDVSQKASAYVPDSEAGADAINAVARDARADVGGTVKLGVNEAVETIGGKLFGEHKGDLRSFGKAAIGDFAQSIGGGGGASNLQFAINDEASFDLGVLLGGSASGNASGGAVDLGRAGTVLTTGARAFGGSVQSIGGGGGFVNLEVDVSAVPASEAASAYRPMTAASLAPDPGARGAAAVPAGPRAVVTLGSSGSTATDGGSIDLTYSGDLLTEGERAHGLVVQSIGGGGGNALVSGLASLRMNLGGTDGATGDGGSIALANTGLIQTAGAQAHGVILQSIGGGGGAAFTDMAASAVEITTRADNQGDGAAVGLDQVGSVQVFGADAIAILAQSLGGGGGLVDRAFADTAGGAGRGGTIRLDVSGDVVAAGAGGVGIFAQSRGRDGQGDITVDVAQGRTVYAGSGGTAVWIDGGSHNQVTVRGDVATADGLAGMAIRGGAGDDTIDSYGMLVGCFDLGGGANRLVVHRGGAFVMGPTLAIGGVESRLVNEGTLYSGAAAVAQTVALDGSFEQGAQGVSRVDLDFGSDTVDQILATGRADVAGRVELTLHHPELVPAGMFSKTLFGGARGASIRGATLQAPDSVVMTSALGNTSGTAVSLDYTVDFAPDGLSTNASAVGDYINRVQNAGSSPQLADTIVRLLYESDLGDYREALVDMSPDFYGQEQVALIQGGQQFSRSLVRRLPVEGGADADNHWASWVQQEEESDAWSQRGDWQAVDRSTHRTTFGTQYDGQAWGANFGVAIESARADGRDRRWTARADIQRVGASVARQWGTTTVTAAAAWAWDKDRVHRLVAVDEAYSTSATRQLDLGNLSLCASRRFEIPRVLDGKLWLQPSVELGLAQMSADETSETGPGGQNLILRKHSETHTWSTPGLRLGYRYDLGSGLRLMPWLDFGLRYYLGDSETEVTADLQGAPADVDDLTVPVPLGQGARQAEIGVELSGRRNIAVQLSFQHIASDRYHSNRGRIQGSYSF